MVEISAERKTVRNTFAFEHEEINVSSDSSVGEEDSDAYTLSQKDTDDSSFFWGARYHQDPIKDALTGF